MATETRQVQEEQESARMDTPKVISNDSRTASEAPVSSASVTPASPLPWRIGLPATNGSSSAVPVLSSLKDGRDPMVARCHFSHSKAPNALRTHEVAQADAHYIVHAANCYPDLLAALKAAKQFLNIDISRGPASDGWVNTCALVEEALAKAEGPDA